MISLICGIQKTKTDSQIQRTNRWLPDGKGVGELSEKGEGIKYKLIIIKQAQGSGVQCREYSQ